VQGSRRSRRLRRALRRAGYRGVHVDGLEAQALSSSVAPQPSRPMSTPFVVAPGKTRYQRRSAGLPRGIVGFPGLGVEAPQFTIDLTQVDAELAEWTS